MAVYLVGAGPGDPGLLTVRGAEVLRRADVVIYDRLSVEALLDLAPPTAERISVGKVPGSATFPQDAIHALLIQRARAGEEVVRLKGGDPFVFARGGEEAAALAAAGIPFEVIPGVSSAIAAPAYAGVPVTLRHSSTSFTVVTGHEEPSAGEGGSVDWRAIARVGGTIVILMGVGRIRWISEELIAGGLDPSTPVVAVQWGTRPDQRTTRATLGTIAAEPLEAPSVIVVGMVASIQLDWFETRPLFGRSVVVTRPRDQAQGLVDRLRRLGAATVAVPAIEVADPADGGAGLRAAATRLGSYDWIVLTSANGARRLLDAVAATGGDARRFAGARIAAIGPGTAEALAAGNLAVDLLPERFVAESLLAAFPEPPDRSRSAGRVLLARAEVARDVLPAGLRARGWTVEVVAAYRTQPVPVAPAQREAVSRADIVTFTSSSTVERFLAAMQGTPIPPVVACIGPVTASAARSSGLEVAIEPAVHTVEGLVDALVAWARQRR